jgi:hypothetical protein
LALALSLAACSNQSSAIGSYIASDPSAAVMVQITSLEGHNIGGYFSLVSAEEGGKVEAGRRPFSGTIEDGALNLSVENGTGVSLVTGHLDGGNLQLTFFNNGASTKLTFEKSDAAKFDQTATRVREAAAGDLQQMQAVAAAQQNISHRSDQQKSIDRLTSLLEATTTSLAENTRKIPLAIAAYHTAGAKTQTLQQARAGLSAASYDSEYKSSQIEYAIDGMKNQVEQAHANLSQMAETLSRVRQSKHDEADTMFSQCQADSLLNCNGLRVSLSKFDAATAEFQGNFAREQAAFQEFKGR